MNAIYYYVSFSRKELRCRLVHVLPAGGKVEGRTTKKISTNAWG